MTTPCVSDLALPPDDGAICCAIEDLRTKIAAWSDAVAEVDRRLATRAADHSEEPNQASDDGNTVAPQHAAPQTTRAPNATDTETAAPTAESAAETDAPIEQSVTEHQPDVAARMESVDPTTADPALEEQREAATDAPIEDANETRVQEPLTDDALLAALAPEAAEAIRVEHRLFNGRRSIRELIEAHRDDPVEPREKRPWWKRGKR